MDVLFFLNERTRFIRAFYETAAPPFEEILRKIEAGEPPYEPPYSEDGEPPFLTEWQEADLGSKVLGQTCVSMLSEALKLYFQTWEAELGVRWEPGERERYFKRGFVQAYKRVLEELCGIPWDQCTADFDLLEQITLARNASQHPEDIFTIEGRHDMKTRARFPSPFFVSGTERHLVSVENPAPEWFAPRIHVDREKLTAAIEEVEKLAEWLETQLFEAKYRHRRSPPA